MEKNSNTAPTNFVRNLVNEDNLSNKFGRLVKTRFPPEPNGYLHIGHAKSMCLNFSIAREFQGTCNLRYDDTNPERESSEYVKAIREDVEWLGFDYGQTEKYASDYFEELYKHACTLIKKGLAYIDSESARTIRERRGTLTTPGENSPFRNRDVNTNLDLFTRMRKGEFSEGEHVLRAKIDMQSPNLNMRDPTLYRIKKSFHQRTGTKWPIYPMYDFTHCISDAIEGITHSLCTLEFEDHRPLYDWVLENLDFESGPQQTEFARLDLEYTVTSKRKLSKLVEEGSVTGWNDPRMPTLKGMRRRGYPPEAIKTFCERIGVTKKQTSIEFSALESAVREELDKTAPRAMAVLDPLKVTIENFPSGKLEYIEVPNHPKNSNFGTREIVLGKEIFIDRADFMLEPPKKYRRLAVGREVRLRYGYVIKCVDAITDRSGNVTELICRYDPDTAQGKTPDGRKVKGIIHWVSATHNVPLKVVLFDRLFNVPNPSIYENPTDHINPESLKVCEFAVGEACLKVPQSHPYQFERLGYFYIDQEQSQNPTNTFNRTVTLRDTWDKSRDQR